MCEPTGPVAGRWSSDFSLLPLSGHIMTSAVASSTKRR